MNLNVLFLPDIPVMSTQFTSGSVVRLAMTSVICVSLQKPMPAILATDHSEKSVKLCLNVHFLVNFNANKRPLFLDRLSHWT